MSFATTAALASGICWGVATYALGRTARKVSPPLLTAIFNFVTFIIFGILFLLSEEISNLGTSSLVSNDVLIRSIASGMLGGVSFAVGLTVIGVALSKGRAGVVGPVTTSWEVLLPFIYAVFASRLPEPIALAGIAILFCVPWLVTRTNSEPHEYSTSVLRDITLASFAGAGFGGYYIGLLLAPASASLLTMTVIQATSGIVMIIAHIKSKRSWALPRATWISASIFIVPEIIGAFTIRYALDHGSPAAVATIASILYVAILLALSYLISREKFTKPQLVGFIATFAGIALVVLNS